MSGLLFVPQHQLERWIEAKQVDVTAQGLRFGDATPLPLEAAFRFLSVQEGADFLGLPGKVKSEAHVRTLGGEALGTSVLVGEVLYEVEAGFLVSLPAGMVEAGPGVAGTQAGGLRDSLAGQAPGESAPDASRKDAAPPPRSP